jgi:hypothetical protein
MTWIEHRACAGLDVNLFFDRNPHKALAVCHRCPVRTECLAATLDVEHGVTGGVTAPTREKMRETAGVSIRVYDPFAGLRRQLPELQSQYTSLRSRESHGLSKQKVHEAYLAAQRKWEAA